MAAPLNVQVSGRHVSVGDALRQRIEEELNAGVGKYFERGGSAEVAVSKDGHSFCVDIVMLLASGQQVVARGLGGDAHTAFDTALAKVETRVRRYKRRLKNHHLHPGGKAMAAELATFVVLRADGEIEGLDEDEDEDDLSGAPAAMVIAEAQAEVRTMTVAMAVMQLDLSDAPVLLFRNAGHGGLSVVYRRDDGNIGWIDPERMGLPRRTEAATPSSKANGASAPAN